MIVNYYRVTDQRTLKRLPGEDALANWLKKSYPLWVDVAEATPEDITELLQPFDLPPILIEKGVGGAASGQVVPLPDVVFFKFPVSGPETASYLSVLMLPVLAITIRHGPIELLDTLPRSAVENRIKLPGKSPAVLVAMIMTALSREDVQAVLAKRAAVNRLTSNQEKDVDSVSIDDILQIKGELRAVESVAEEMRQCFDTLSRTRLDAFDAHEAGYNLQIALSNAEFMERQVDRLNASAEDLYNRHMVGLQERTNRRLAILTVLSAVFLPLTLIAGIEGMNFERMPELKWAYGYEAALGLMAVTAIILVLLFWRKGWFD